MDDNSGKAPEPSGKDCTVKKSKTVTREEKTAEPMGFRRYKKGKFLERTIYGATRLGKDTVEQKWVVIKECLIKSVLSKTYNGQSVKEDVTTEIDVHQRIICGQGQELCPFIVELIDVNRDKEFINIILEYASGGDLYSEIDTRTKEIVHIWETSSNRAEKERVVKDRHDDVRKWIRQLLIAIKFMHERNVCHRDISLENIVLSGSRDVKVIDFGVAHEYKDGNFSSEYSRIGKKSYMSPECYQQHHYNGRDNDMWCAGVVLWMCLVGCPPWDIPSVQDKRFAFLMQGKIGVKKLAALWKRAYLVTDSAADLLSKIFRPQKERITVNEALNHPFITGERELHIEPELYVPFPENRFLQLPERELSDKWRSFREKGQLIEPPKVWAQISETKREIIQKYLWQVNKISGCIFDKRVTRKLVGFHGLHVEDAHDILVYFMAASRNRTTLAAPRESSNIIGRKPSPVLKYNLSERKLQERKENVHENDENTSKEEEKDYLLLRAVFCLDEEEPADSHLLKVESNATLNQIKVEFSLLRTKKLSLPFIPPKELDLLLNGDLLEDTIRLRNANLLRGHDLIPPWFRKLSKDELQTCHVIFKSSYQESAQPEKVKQKFLEEISTNFNIENSKCEDVWVYISSQQDLEFRDQMSLDGIAEGCEWLKMLSCDAFGRDFALLLGNIVIANKEDKIAAQAHLEQEGLTRSKALQAIEHFSRTLQENVEDGERDPIYKE